MRTALNNEHLAGWEERGGTWEGHDGIRGGHPLASLERERGVGWRRGAHREGAHRETERWGWGGGGCRGRVE